MQGECNKPMSACALEELSFILSHNLHQSTYNNNFRGCETIETPKAIAAIPNSDFDNEAR